MESSKEKIEAQLCAYIDGELTDAERVEIEHHLASNPQHRKLIEELRLGSGLLRSLPRATVPAELNESLTGQLERTALLDPTEDETSEAVLSINRWPQITAVAAVLLLAAGLAIVVNYVLPNGQPGTNGTIAVNDKGLKVPTDGSGTTRLSDKDADGSKRDLASALADGVAGRSLGDPTKPLGTDAPDLSLAKKVDDRALAGGLEAGKGLNVQLQQDARGVATDKEVNDLRRRMSESFADGNASFDMKNAVVLMVSAPDASAANTQVTTYFKANNIQYMYGEMPEPTSGGAALATTFGAKVAENLSYGASGKATAPGAAAPALPDRLAAKPENKLEERFGGGAGGGGGIGGRAATRGGNAGGGVESTIERYAPPRDEKQVPAEDTARRKQGETDTYAAASEKPAPNEKGTPGDGVRQELERTSKTESIAPVDVTSKVKAGAEPAPVPPAPGAQAVGGPAVAKNGVDVAQVDQLSLSRPVTSGQAQQGRVTDEALKRNGVILARMNRRQAAELRTTLSREKGQYAELKSAAPTEGLTVPHTAYPVGPGYTPAAGLTVDDGRNDRTRSAPARPDSALAGQAGKTATTADLAAIDGSPTNKPNPDDGWRENRNLRGATPPTTTAAAAPASRPVLQPTADKATQWHLPPGDTATGAREPRGRDAGALRLTPDPMDDPVDVVIVLKDAPGATAPSAPTLTPDVAAPAVTPPPAAPK